MCEPLDFKNVEDAMVNVHVCDDVFLEISCKKSYHNLWQNFQNLERAIALPCLMLDTPLRLPVYMFGSFCEIFAVFVVLVFCVIILQMLCVQNLL